MSLRAAHRDDVASPCVSICTLDPTGDYCTGCYRTLDEIGQWARYSPDEKRAVIAVLPQRRAVVLREPDDRQ
jgi:predicted Fe-S protein YdhL (DUF1289 family)